MAVVGGGGTPLETLLQQLMRAASEDELRSAAHKVSSCVQTVGECTLLSREGQRAPVTGGGIFSSGEVDL